MAGGGTRPLDAGNTTLQLRFLSARYTRTAHGTASASFPFSDRVEDWRRFAVRKDAPKAHNLQRNTNSWGTGETRVAPTAP